MTYLSTNDGPYAEISTKFQATHPLTSQIVQIIELQSPTFQLQYMNEYLARGYGDRLPESRYRDVLGPASAVYVNSEAGRILVTAMFFPQPPGAQTIVPAWAYSVVSVSSDSGTSRRPAGTALLSGTAPQTEDELVEEAIRLSALVMERLPETLPEMAPLTFPETLDEAAGAAIFSSIEIGKMVDGEFVAASDFELGNGITIKTTPAVAGETPVYSVAICDERAWGGKYWQVAIGVQGGGVTPFSAVQANSTSFTDVRIAVGDQVVAVIPITVTYND